MAVFQSLACGKCGRKRLVYEEDFHKRQGIYTAPYLFCKSCFCQVFIPFTTIGDSKVFRVNRKANKCAGGTCASL